MLVSLPPDVESRLDQFTGREWLLPILTDWLEAGSERVFLLVGDPGTGKSMIMAWLTGAGQPADEQHRLQLEQLRRHGSFTWVRWV